MRSITQSTWDFFLRPYWILRAYKPDYLRPDLIAGLTIAVVLLPQAIAYALIAELPLEMGLYSAIIGSIIGALWGSSSHLQTGPTNTSSLLVLSVLLVVATPGTSDYLLAAGLLTLLVGLFRLGMGLVKLGLLVNFVSDSVIVGFAAGAGLLIFFNQLRHILRLEIPSEPGLMGTLQNLGAHLPETHGPSLLLGIGTMLIILILGWWKPKLPTFLIAICATSLVVGILELQTWGVEVLGELPRGLPPLTPLPITNLTLIGQLSMGALAIAAVGLVEAMSIARSIASQTGQRLNSDQEFIGQGLANITCGFFGGYTCAGSFTRSAINHQAGAQTALSNVFCGLLMLIAILAFGSYAAYIPLPALAGVVLIVALRLIEVKEMRRMWQSARGDRVIMLVTLGATLLLPLTVAVMTGILLSLGYYLLQTSTPRVRTVLPDANFEYLVRQSDRPACPQLGIIEILGDLYFGAVHHFEECILINQARNPSQRFLLLRMFSVEHCDISGIHALEGIVRGYRERGGDVFISRYQSPVVSIMRDSGFSMALGEDHFLGRDQNAIGHLFYRVLDPAICIYECPLRVFRECQNLPKRLDLIGDYPQTGIPDGEVKYVEALELWAALHEGEPPIVVDVREPREFQSGSILQACSIPFPGLLNDPSQLPDDNMVVLVCRSGRRSTRAASTLSIQGFDNLAVLKGGMLAWEAKNLLQAVGDRQVSDGNEITSKLGA